MIIEYFRFCKLPYQKKEKHPADDSGKDTTEASDDSGKDTTEEEDVGEEVSSEEQEGQQGILYNKTNLKPYKGGFFKRKIHSGFKAKKEGQ